MPLSSTVTNMAGYHYKLQIIPGNSEIFVDENYWLNEQPNSLMLNKFRELLPIDCKWGETEEFRSEENHSVLCIWWENHKVWNLQFEYAPVCKGEDALLNQVLALCIEYGYMLYSEQTETVVAPNKNELWQNFKKCSQYEIYEKRLNEFH